MSNTTYVPINTLSFYTNKGIIAIHQSPVFVLFSKKYIRKSHIQHIFHKFGIKFASSASVYTEAPCLLAGRTPNPPKTSFHSESRPNRLVLFSFLPAAFVLPFAGNGLHCTWPSDNPSSPCAPAGTRRRSASWQPVLFHIPHSGL